MGINNLSELTKYIDESEARYKKLEEEKEAKTVLLMNCEEVEKELIAENRQLKAANVGIEKIAGEVFKLYEFYERRNDSRATEYLNIFKDLRKLENPELVEAK